MLRNGFLEGLSQSIVIVGEFWGWGLAVSIPIRVHNFSIERTSRNVSRGKVFLLLAQ